MAVHADGCPRGTRLDGCPRGTPHLDEATSPPRGRWPMRWLSTDPRVPTWPCRHGCPRDTVPCVVATSLTWLSQRIVPANRSQRVAKTRSVRHGCPSVHLPWLSHRACPTAGWLSSSSVLYLMLMAVPAPSPVLFLLMGVPAPISQRPSKLPDDRGWLSSLFGPRRSSCNVPTFGEESANAMEPVPMTKSLLAPSAVAEVSPATSRRPAPASTTH